MASAAAAAGALGATACTVAMPWRSVRNRNRAVSRTPASRARTSNGGDDGGRDAASDPHNASTRVHTRPVSNRDWMIGSSPKTSACAEAVSAALAASARSRSRMRSCACR